MLNRLVIDNGIFLDDKKLKGVREYSVIHNEEDNLATLTLKMDVTILGKVIVAQWFIIGAFAVLVYILQAGPV